MLIDATIVRLVLVPATMALLGDAQLVAAGAGSTASLPHLEPEPVAARVEPRTPQPLG